jgi:signal transduction histidine kinase
LRSKAVGEQRFFVNDDGIGMALELREFAGESQQQRHIAGSGGANCEHQGFPHHAKT